MPGKDHSCPHFQLGSRISLRRHRFLCASAHFSPGGQIVGHCGQFLVRRTTALTKSKKRRAQSAEKPRDVYSIVDHSTIDFDIVAPPFATARSPAISLKEVLVYARVETLAALLLVLVKGTLP
jgi:hypothetical protein